MRYLAIFLASISIVLGSVSSAQAFDRAKLFDAYLSVVMVRGYDTKGGLAYGSGVVVATNKVITNCHVLRATKQPWISRGEDSYAITTVQADRWHDLCLVTTDQMPFKAAVLGKSTDLKRGQEIVSIGNSNGVPAPLTSSGSVKGMYDADAGKVIRTSAKFAMGASGSGLFDLDGRLVGINTFKTAGKSSAFFFSLPIEWLSILEKQPIETSLPIEGKALWEEDEDKKPYYMQAAVPEAREDWAKLAEVASKWTTAEPKSADAWFELGIAAENISKVAEAEAAYRHAVDLDTSFADAFVRIGVIAKEKGDTAEMHRVNLKLAEIDPDIAAQYSDLLGCGAQC